MRFDPDQFEERAAIAEFDGGASRFDAETLAAQEQGVPRWQALKFVKEARDAQRGGVAGGHGDQAHAMARQRDADDLPGVQCASQEENRSMPECDAQAGRDRGALLALQLRGREAV